MHRGRLAESPAARRRTTCFYISTRRVDDRQPTLNGAVALTVPHSTRNVAPAGVSSICSQRGRPARMPCQRSNCQSSTAGRRQRRGRPPVWLSSFASVPEWCRRRAFTAVHLSVCGEQPACSLRALTPHPIERRLRCTEPGAGHTARPAHRGFLRESSRL
jgi:hypothetical protein